MNIGHKLNKEVKYMSKEQKRFAVYALASLLLSCLLYAISVTAFINSDGSNLLPAGVSGLAMVISRYVVNVKDVELFYSIIYITMNIPLFILAYKNIGKVFSVITFLNVVITSFLIAAIPNSFWDFLKVENMQLLDIALFAGVLSGASIGVALKANLSTGGTDIVALYFSIKKGVSIGKYVMALNAFVLVLGGILSHDINAMLYTLVYIGVSSVVIDMIYMRTKKVMVEVVSNKGEEIASTLLKDAGHGVTVLPAVGAYSKENKEVLHMVISARQTREVIELIHNIDKESFIVQLPVEQVYGKFYMPPFK